MNVKDLRSALRTTIKLRNETEDKGWRNHFNWMIWKAIKRILKMTEKK